MGKISYATIMNIIKDNEIPSEDADILLELVKEVEILRRGQYDLMVSFNTMALSFNTIVQYLQNTRVTDIPNHQTTDFLMIPKWSTSMTSDISQNYNISYSKLVNGKLVNVSEGMSQTIRAPDINSGKIDCPCDLKPSASDTNQQQTRVLNTLFPSNKVIDVKNSNFTIK
jgi:hypothetical protein